MRWASYRAKLLVPGARDLRARGPNAFMEVVQHYLGEQFREGDRARQRIRRQ
jgi:hypothetical protein